MNINLINSLYTEITKSSSGVLRTKVDLHVHTPASCDFIPRSKDAYTKILDEAIHEDIGIIAITDHNTFEGINYIRKLLEDSIIASTYKNILILCGIEITCFSKHILAIFPKNFSAKCQDDFLKDIGIDEDVQGTKEALADNLGPALLIKKIGQYGGFALLAHADTNNGFLQSLCSRTESELSFSGKSLAKIIKSRDLYGIQCNNNVNEKIIKEKLHNIDFERESSALAYIKCSDCHGVKSNGQYTGKSGHPIGSFYSDIKLSEQSFEALKMALLDSEMRISHEFERNPYPYIVGVAIKSDIIKSESNYAVFHFNPELNCIIGSRGTGKTTLLEIIQSIIMPNSLDSSTLERAFRKYGSAVVYVKNANDIYAISNEPKTQSDSYIQEVCYISDLKIYRKESSASTFGSYQKNKNSSFLKRFLTAGYQQRQLFDYSRNPNKILNIVDNFIS